MERNEAGISAVRIAEWSIVKGSDFQTYFTVTHKKSDYFDATQYV